MNKETTIRHQNIRAAMSKIAQQFPKTSDGMLNLAVVAQAARDLALPPGEKGCPSPHAASALVYLSGFIPHAEICGVDSNWIQRQFRHVGEL